LCFYFKYQCHAVRINLDKKKKLHVYKKAWTLVQWLDSPPWQC
jgi:hypothetical protein